MSSSYQINIADVYNIPIGTVKKWVPKFFDKDMYVIHLITTMNLIRKKEWKQKKWWQRWKVLHK